jgi:MFS family permease
MAILLMGHGLQLTLLPVHAEAQGWSAYAIALSGSAYFLGFVAGCIAIPVLVGRVGHIRIFMVMGAIATIALLLAGVFFSLPVWLILRFGTGFALCGLYMVIESWLSEIVPEDQRGRVLAFYTMICLVGMSVGQTFLGLVSPLSLELFVVGAVLLSLATIPVGLSRISAPHPIPGVRFSARVLTRSSPVAVVGAFAGGLVMGAFWTVGPAQRHCGRTRCMWVGRIPRLLRGAARADEGGCAGSAPDHPRRGGAVVGRVGAPAYRER